jgi:hypothetical protein
MHMLRAGPKGCQVMQMGRITSVAASADGDARGPHQQTVMHILRRRGGVLRVMQVARITARGRASLRV